MNLPMVRASSMPLAANCPASISGEGVQIDSYDPTATDGVDVHRAIALALRGKEYPAFEGENAAENEDMVALALAYAKQSGLCDDQMQTERHFEFSPFAATLDLLVVDIAAGEAELTDWKTTHREDDHEAQILTQCECVFEAYEDEIQSIETHLVYLRNEGVKRKRYTRDFVGQWREEFIHNTLEHPEVYRPGEWCGRCKRKVGCLALRAVNENTAAILSAPEYAANLSRPVIANLRPRVKMLKDVIDQFDAYVREEVLTHGPIPLGNGKELRAMDINTDKIGILKAWEILTAQFTDQELAGFVEVRKTALCKLIEASAPKGGKSKASAAFMDRLRAAGAVAVTTTQQVREMNVRE